MNQHKYVCNYKNNIDIFTFLHSVQMQIYSHTLKTSQTLSLKYLQVSSVICSMTQGLAEFISMYDPKLKYSILNDKKMNISKGLLHKIQCGQKYELNFRIMNYLTAIFAYQCQFCVINLQNKLHLFLDNIIYFVISATDQNSKFNFVTVG